MSEEKQEKLEKTEKQNEEIRELGEVMLEENERQYHIQLLSVIGEIEGQDVYKRQERKPLQTPLLPFLPGQALLENAVN